MDAETVTKPNARSITLPGGATVTWVGDDAQKPAPPRPTMPMQAALNPGQIQELRGMLAGKEPDGRVLNLNEAGSFVPGGQAAEINPDALDPQGDDVLELDRSMLVNPDDPTNPDKRSNQQGDTGMSDESKPAPPASGGPQPAPVGASIGGAGQQAPAPTFTSTRSPAADLLPPPPVFAPHIAVPRGASLFGSWHTGSGSAAPTSSPSTASAQNTPASAARPKNVLSWWIGEKWRDWWLGGLVILALLVVAALVAFVLKSDLLDTPRSTALSVPIGDPLFAARVLNEAVAPTSKRVDGLERRIGEQGNTIATQQAQIADLQKKLAQAQQNQGGSPNASSKFWADVLKELQRMHAEDRARIPQS